MPGTLTKLFLTATLLLSGGIASADSWRGPANPNPTPAPAAPAQLDARDHRGPGPDRFDRDERNDRARLDRDQVAPRARVEHYRPRRGFVWIAGQWERGPRGRWVWQPGHYERVRRGHY